MNAGECYSINMIAAYDDSLSHHCKTISNRTWKLFNGEGSDVTVIVFIERLTGLGDYVAS